MASLSNPTEENHSNSAAAPQTQNPNAPISNPSNPSGKPAFPVWTYDTNGRPFLNIQPLMTAGSFPFNSSSIPFHPLPVGNGSFIPIQAPIPPSTSNVPSATTLVPSATTPDHKSEETDSSSQVNTPHIDGRPDVINLLGDPDDESEVDGDISSGVMGDVMDLSFGSDAGEHIEQEACGIYFAKGSYCRWGSSCHKSHDGSISDSRKKAAIAKLPPRIQAKHFAIVARKSDRKSNHTNPRDDRRGRQQLRGRRQDSDRSRERSRGDARGSRGRRNGKRGDGYQGRRNSGRLDKGRCGEVRLEINAVDAIRDLGRDLLASDIETVAKGRVFAQMADTLRMTVKQGDRRSAAERHSSKKQTSQKKEDFTTPARPKRSH